MDRERERQCNYKNFVRLKRNMFKRKSDKS